MSKKLIVFSGYPLTGKTYISKKISEELNIRTVDVDEIRKFLQLENDNLKNKNELDIMICCYNILCNIAYESLFTLNQSIIISGTFSKREFKQNLYKLLEKVKKENIDYTIFTLIVEDENEIKKRVKKRNLENSMSNINTLEKYNLSKTFFSKIEDENNIKIYDNSFKKILKIIKNN